jgi:drug/metabolite transporter (DMT)-like permease
MAACLGRLPVWIEGAFDTRREQLVFVGLLLLGWLTLNVGLHFFSLYAVSERIGFDFPLFYTMWHMIISFGGSSLLIFGFQYAEISWVHWKAYKGQIILLSVLFCISYAANIASLAHLSLSVNLGVSACVPLPTIAFSVAFERDAVGQPIAYPRRVVAAVLVTMAGASVAVANHPEASPFGLVLVIIASLAAALWAVVSATLMKPETGLGAINLTWYSSFLSALMFLAMWLCSRELSGTLAFIVSRPGEASALLLAGGCLALLYNLSHFALIRASSALSATVAGDLKIVLFTLLSMALFERPAPSPLIFIGTFIFVVGLAGYAYAANRDKRQLLCRDGREDGDAEGGPSAEEAYAAQVKAQVKRVKLEPQTPPPRRQTPLVTETSTLIGK